jgi:hypothetical protein
MNMPDKADGPLFSPTTIKKLTKWMQNEVAYVMRLQSRGILPYCKPAEKIIIETADIQRILGKQPRTAQRYMAWLRKKLNKTKEELISVEEFIDKTKLPRDVVYRALYLIPHEYPKEAKREKQ